MRFAKHRFRTNGLTTIYHRQAIQTYQESQGEMVEDDFQQAYNEWLMVNG